MLYIYTKNIVCDCDVRFNEEKDGSDLLNCVEKGKMKIPIKII